MARRATKATGNVWFEARITASEQDGRLRSREGAAELLGLSVSALADTELGLYKVMPPDKAVLMSELYHAPQLLNHYCLNECPIGRDSRSISDQVLPIERVTVKMLRHLRVEQLEGVKDTLLEIAEDGEVNEDELPDLEDLIEYLDGLSRTISELKLIAKAARRGRKSA